MLRILFLGENWYGSCARACCYALRRLGCEVRDIDSQTIFPQVRLRSSRAWVRVFKKRLFREYNDLILDSAFHFRPDILLAFKGPFVDARTLGILRERGIALYNYYPDRVALAAGTLIEKSLPEYDCVFDTKRKWDGDARDRIKLRDSVFLPHGYDPDLHRPIELEQRDIEQHSCDVSLIATRSPRKEGMLRDLVALKPDIDLRIWGNQWQERCQAPELRRYIRGPAIVGDQYCKAIRATRINLAIMGIVREAVDETTTRTYEIPACEGFMLHERTDEVVGLFEEGKEMACFRSARELVEKIDHYLAHPEEANAIARAGYARCVPAYSYDNRMAEIISWHRAHYAK